MNFFLLLIVGVAIAVNAMATLSVVRSDSFDARQKTFQLLIIWFIPILGGCLSWSLAREDRVHRRHTKSPDSGESEGDGYIPLDSAADTGGGEGGAGGDH